MGIDDALERVRGDGVLNCRRFGRRRRPLGDADFAAFAIDGVYSSHPAIFGRSFIVLAFMALIQSRSLPKGGALE